MTGNMGDTVNAESAYAQSFGMLPNKTVYSNPTSQVDRVGELRTAYGAGLKAHNAQLKAHNTGTGGAGTAGFALIPVYVDERITDISRKYTPMTMVMPRVTNRGVTADYNVLLAKGPAFTAFEDGSMQETDDQYERRTSFIKYLYSVGRVTGQSNAAQPSYIMGGMVAPGSDTGAFGDAAAPNAMQQRVLTAARSLKELEEQLIMTGNSTSSVAGGPNGSEFDGIVTLQGTTNKVDKNNTEFDLDDIDAAIQLSYDNSGRPNFGVCDSSTFKDMLGLLKGKIGFMAAATEVLWGFQGIKLNTAVGTIPVIMSQYLSNTTGQKSLYFLDLSVWEMRVLQDMSYEKLAKTNDSEKFMLKIYETLICKNTLFNSFVGEIL